MGGRRETLELMSVLCEGYSPSCMLKLIKDIHSVVGSSSAWGMKMRIYDVGCSSGRDVHGGRFHAVQTYDRGCSKVKEAPTYLHVPSSTSGIT